MATIIDTANKVGNHVSQGRSVFSYAATTSLISLLGSSALFMIYRNGGSREVFGSILVGVALSTVFAPLAIWSVDRLEIRGLNRFLAVLPVGIAIGVLIGLVISIFNRWFWILIPIYVVPITLVVGVIAVAADRMLQKTTVLPTVLVVATVTITTIGLVGLFLTK